MAIITIQPESNTATNWTGLPANSATRQWENVDEGVSTADNDVSYSSFTDSTNLLTLNFADPTLPADQKVLFVRVLIKWRAETVSLTSLQAKLNWTTYGQTQLFDETMSSSTSSYLEWSLGENQSSPPSESDRKAIEWTEAEAADLVLTLEGLDDPLRITAVEIELGTGYVEESSGGGCVMGGQADIGPTRQARVGAKVGGKVNDVFNVKSKGGAIISPGSNIKDFNDATPFIDGGAAVGGEAVVAFFGSGGFLKKTFDINSDLVITYSGGLLNSNPNASLGGDASPVPVYGDINNLFDDITPDDADNGQIDYRCFYIFNQHQDETIYNIKTWIDFDVPKGANVKLGIESRDELQTITFNNVPTSGFFTIRYEPSNPLGFAPVKVNASPSGDINEFANNLQTALRIIPDLRDVSVTANVFGTGLILEVLFTNLDGQRQEEKMNIVQNTLSPITDIAVKRVQRGSPVNSVAASINIDITPPSNVSFSVPTKDFPFVIPKLKEGEGFHVWVERTITPDDESLANDGFHLGVSVEPVEPSVET